MTLVVLEVVMVKVWVEKKVSVDNEWIVVV